MSTLEAKFKQEFSFKDVDSSASGVGRTGCGSGVGGTGGAGGEDPYSTTRGDCMVRWQGLSGLLEGSAREGGCVLCMCILNVY